MKLFVVASVFCTHSESSIAQVSDENCTFSVPGPYFDKAKTTSLKSYKPTKKDHNFVEVGATKENVNFAYTQRGCNDVSWNMKLEFEKDILSTKDSKQWLKRIASTLKSLDDLRRQTDSSSLGTLATDIETKANEKAPYKWGKDVTGKSESFKISLSQNKKRVTFDILYWVEGVEI